MTRARDLADSADLAFDGDTLKIDSANNRVGIGTASPSNALTLNSAAGGTSGLRITSTEGSGFRIRAESATTTMLNVDSGESMLFGTGGTERMRIDSSGKVLVGTTTTNPADNNDASGVQFDPALGSIQTSAGTATPAIFNRGNNGNCIGIHRGGTLVGSVSVTTSGTTYNTTSDIRLKTDIAPIADATETLMSMNAVTHKWKADPDADAVVGFIAQEMAEIVPEAVSKGESEDDMWSMDYGRITPVLVAALQDAHKKIKQLEQRIAEMEAK